MSDTPLWQKIESTIAASVGRPFQIEDSHPVGGGCINTAYRISGGDDRYFVKLNDAALFDMFESEAAGLRMMADSGSVRVPVPLCTGVADRQAFLVLEYIPLQAAGGATQQLLGLQLARMHRASGERFGWHEDNYVGATPQKNEWSADWVSFWAEQRIHFQLQLAGRNGYTGSLQKQGENLCADLAGFFGSYQPCPSLLHGDLWGGNFSADERGQPVLYDPACYYGDREADLAMTELFGGFGSDFYAAYDDAWALDAGFGVRKVLYNLYHILNHLNLFGGGYHSQAEAMIRQLNAELR